MKKILFAWLLSYVLLSCTYEDNRIEVGQVSMKWQYDYPGTKFWEGLPIGTGRFGAMIPGNIDHEVIAFNDETLWSGGPYNPNNPKAPEAVKALRKYAFSKKWAAADEESYKLFSNPVSVQFYQPMGRLNVQMGNGHDMERVTGYSRVLNMDSALVDVQYNLDGVTFFRHVFASYPDQVIVLRYIADQKNKVGFTTWLTSLQPSAVTRVEENEIIMEGTTISEKEGETILPPQSCWQSRLKVIQEGGGHIDGDKIIVTDADAVTLVLAGATNWVSWNDVSADEKKRCSDYILQASRFNWKELLQRHLDDYCPLFASCRLDLGEDMHPGKTTTQTMEALRRGELDPAYEVRYFQYGRYLMLAAAREGTLAFNNHNMWLDDMDGRWRGRWTLNINIQECYWPVENTNIPTVNESLLLFTENLAQAGTRTAKEHFGVEGWCAGHGTDGWFNTAPTDSIPCCGLWCWGGHWIMQQLYDHYKFAPDKKYLERIYPLLKGAASFCLSYLIKDPDSSYLVTCPSTSPENSFKDNEGNIHAVSYGAAGEIQIVRCTLRNFIEACSILKIDTSMAEAAEKAIELLPPHQVGRFGQLQEWFFDFDEPEVTHRHTSHLFAFYPDDDISLHKTPEWINAVETVLDRRGDINKGWSGAWKINMYARLEKAEEAYRILRSMLTDVSIHPNPEDSQITPSFEGNQAIQGVTAGITEMLIQSHGGELSLLPALPEAWEKGEVSGLRARGGFYVDITWKENRLDRARMEAKYDTTCQLRTKTPVKIFFKGKEVEECLWEKGVLEFPVHAGETYQIIAMN